MTNMAVNTTIGNQTNQMHRATPSTGIFNRSNQCRIFKKLTTLDFIVDTHQILTHNCTTTQRHMTDFGITHLTIG